MADDITNKVLLEHMQTMKYEIQTQMQTMKSELLRHIVVLDKKVSSLEVRVTNGFEEARQHRQALQEDLEETMRVQSKHGSKLARL